MSVEEKILDLKELDNLDDVTTIDLAEELSDYDDDQIKIICNKLDDEKLAGVVEQSEFKNQNRILKLLDNKRILSLFNYMSKDDIVDILGDVNIAKSKELLKLMKEGDQKIIKELLGYEDDTAGGLMTTEYIRLYVDMTIEDAIKKIKEIAPKTEMIDVIFIVNADKEFVGTVELRDILIAPETETLQSIVDKHYIYVVPETDQEEVARLVQKYDLKAIPVLNKRRSLLGIITIDDIVDVLVEEQTEDVLKMGGVSEVEEIDSKVGESIKLRLPWLIVNLLTAFLASFTVKMFESTIAQVVALSSIMSIVTGMGGNAGTQTVSVIIRNIAMGKVELKDSLPILFKQLKVDLVNGIVIGIITGIIVSAVYGNIYLGVIIFLAMICNLIISGFFGILIPLILAKMKFDPALSSSIFLTTATDVLGFFVFLSLAKVFLPVLI
jgi:magnesium transporter